MRRVWLGAALILLAVWMCGAQQAPSPEFEVASVKKAVPGPHEGVWANTPDRVWMYSMSVKQLVEFAYKLKDYQAFANGWMETEKYDVVGKVSAETAKLPFDEKFLLMRRMTRGLLAQRFQLTIHRESRDLPVYALVVAKGGSKIQELGPNPGENVRAQISAGHLSAERMPMSQLIAILGNQLDRPVLDDTGIKGIFDVKLEWTPDSADKSDLVAKPPLYMALEEQLGLKLETRKSPIEVVVVDKAERPSEN